ncbi:MAG: hypothetical protein ABIR55_12560, partial [Burkholderiaceae bacterium]
MFTAIVPRDCVPVLGASREDAGARAVDRWRMPVTARIRAPAADGLLRHLERPALPRPGWRDLLSDFGPGYAAHGFIGWVFAATAPVAILLSVGTRGGLSEAELAS